MQYSVLKVTNGKCLLGHELHLFGKLTLLEIFAGI